MKDVFQTKNLNVKMKSILLENNIACRFSELIVDELTAVKV